MKSDLMFNCNYCYFKLKTELDLNGPTLDSADKKKNYILESK